MIQYRSATKIFGTGEDAVLAVNNVTFDIAAGELVVFLGPSGCGKTTLLRLTNRLERLTSGEIFLKGKPVRAFDGVRLRQSMGYVIQQIGLFPNKTIAENVSIVPKILGWNNKRIGERVDELLSMMNLDPSTFRNRYPVELSGGQQQRVGVARALAADPDVLLMDEPFGAVDPINRAVILEEFLKLHGRLKKTVAFVSHDVHEAIKVADRIAVFKEGSLVQYDRPQVLLTRPKERFVSEFFGTDHALKVLGLLKVKDAIKIAVENIAAASTPSSEALKMLDDTKMDRAVVVEHGKPVGIATRESLAQEKGSVEDAADTIYEVADHRTSLRDALSWMLMHNTDLLYVIDDNGDLLGTISYRDIQKCILEIYDK